MVKSGSCRSSVELPRCWGINGGGVYEQCRSHTPYAGVCTVSFAELLSFEVGVQKEWLVFVAKYVMLQNV